jgi:hypothetical protein
MSKECKKHEHPLMPSTEPGMTDARHLEDYTKKMAHGYGRLD